MNTLHCLPSFLTRLEKQQETARLAVVHVTEKLAKEYCQKIIHLASLSFDKGMEAQKSVDDSIIENILNKSRDVLNDKKEI